MADPFLAAVLAAPDDDLPRLVYADYLEERGDPRGEFIRLQVELARLDSGDPRRGELLARETELQSAHEDEWLGSLGDELIHWWFHRGFLEVRFDIRRFLDGDTKFLANVAVAGIHLVPPPSMDADLVIRLARSPKTRRVRSLYLAFEWVRDVVAQALAESAYTANVVFLDLSNNGLTDLGVFALAAGGGMPGLRVLGLHNNLITDRGATALATSTDRTALRQLDLTNNEIGSAGAAALAASAHLGGLTQLRLAGNRFDGRSRGGRALKKRFGGVATWR